jgi:site-specific recombinase XerD
MSGDVARLYNVNEGWEKVLARYLLHRRADGLAERTLKDYTIHISRFFSKYPQALETPEQVREYVLQYMAKDRSPAYHNITLRYLRVFFKWTVRQGVLYANPTDGIKLRKAQPRIVNHGKDIIRALIDQPDRTTFVGLRDYALILLTMDSGIRPGESLQLQVEDINIPGSYVTVRAEVSKTREPRTMPLSAPTTKAIIQLIAVRPSDWEGAPLFCTCSGTPLVLQSWRYRLKTYGGKIGVNIRPYDLRHEFAMEYLRNGGNVFGLQKSMGHSDIATTRRYVEYTMSDLRAAHAKASPVSNLLPSRKRLTRLQAP